MSRRLGLEIGLVLGLSLAVTAVTAEANTPVKKLSLTSIPARPVQAMTGSTFARSTAKMSGADRQVLAVKEILRGNVPSFDRVLRPIHLSGSHRDGTPLRGTVWVTPDYVAIGNDKDFLRMPLTWPSATTVARRFGCVLPTSKIVDAVWRQADHHLTPAPLPPGPRMRSSEYYLRHRSLIESQRGHLPLETLLAGHKKDVVLTGLLARRPDRIAIYGWHRPSGQPIQPLSTVHGARYADYSHGTRLVWERMQVGGVWMSIYDVLADQELAPLISTEGPLPAARALMRSVAGATSAQ